jgi:predicted ribosomally synthesized peptide with nif11-like leader
MNLEELMQNAEFTEKLEKAKDLDEVMTMIKEQGVEITKEELAAAMEQLNEGELDENSLEDVAGGMSLGRAVITGVAVLVSWLKKHPEVLPKPSPLRPWGRR